MKTMFYSFPVLLFAVTEGMAQLTLTKAANEPVAGDIQALVSHDSTTAVPRNKGAAQTWNFTALTSNSFTEVITYTSTASVPSSSLFPGATLASLRGSNNQEFFQSSGADWLFMGEYKSTSGDKFILNNPALFMRWPVSMASTFSDVASGVEVSGSNTVPVTGTLSYEATGTGTVILPGNIIHNNCLQITSTLAVISGSGTSTSTMTQVKYTYYSAGHKLPIAELQYTDESGSSEFSAYLDRSGITVGLTENSFCDVNLSPNPAAELTRLEIPSEVGRYSVQIVDLQGTTLLNVEDDPVVDVSRMGVGVYFVFLRIEGGVIIKKLVVYR